MEVQSSCMTIIARMMSEGPKEVDEDAEDALDDDDVAEEKKRRRELKKKEKSHARKEKAKDAKVDEQNGVMMELSTVDSVNLLATSVKRFPTDPTLLSDASKVFVGICTFSEEARRFVAVSGVVAPYFDAMTGKETSLLSPSVSIMMELVKVASVKAVLHQMHPSERVLKVVKSHMERIHKDSRQSKKDDLARNLMCILVEMSASRELLNDFAETPGLPVVVDVQNTYISDPYIQLCIAGYLCNLMTMKDIPQQFLAAKGLSATVSSLATYVHKHTLMKMFC